MDRKDFIHSLVAVAALQAIPAPLLPVDTKYIQAQDSLTVTRGIDKYIQVPIKFGDILITPDGEAYQVQEVYKHDVLAKVIDGDGYIELSHDQAQQMCCHDWDDLDN